MLGIPPALVLYGAIALAGAGAVVGIYQTGVNSATRRCEATALRSQLAAKDTDLKAAQQTAEAAAAARMESEAAAAAAEQRIGEYETELKARPAGACAITADDLRRVRGHSGAGAR